MNGVWRRFIGLCLLPAALCLLDAGLTLHGQTEFYWTSNYSQVSEGSPTFHQLLSIHPLAFVVGQAVWMAIFIAFLLLVPDVLALIASIAITFGHTAGSATWIYGWEPFGYQLCNGLFLLTAIGMGVAIRYGWGAVPTEEYRLLLSPLWRWLLAAALFAIGVYLFVWPH
jgi:hypothetical protein